MKTLLNSFLFLFFVTISNAQEFKTPLDYLNYIGKESEIISRNTWKYTTTVAHTKNARRIDANRKSLIKSIQNAAKKIEALKDGYNGDVEYKNQLLVYLSILENQINSEYDKIIDMQEVAEQSYDFMEAYILTRDLVNAKINDEVDKLNANQKIFANKYNIQITEDTSELAKKIKISNDVLENHSHLFLIFFKVNFTESLLFKAIEREDISDIQQNSIDLIQYVNEGLEKLKTFKPYKNDKSLILATKKYLEVSKKEALEFSPTVVYFIMLNQKFEESKKIIDNKLAKNRSKEEVNNFNKLVDQVNIEVGNYNRNTNKFNLDRTDAFNNWYLTGDNFIARYVPIN